MKKRFYPFFYLVIAGLWIYMSFQPVEVFQSSGTLLTYRTGIWSLDPPAEGGGEIISLDSTGYTVDIRIDSFGIPHIFGADAVSVGYGLGYMHARDRYFQMELITRVTSGRLSQLVGEQAIALDEFWLPYESERRAKEVFEELADTRPEIHAYLIAYGEGINTYLANESDRERSPEYVLLGVKPRQWEPWYAMMVPDYMSYMLTFADDHNEREYLVNTLPKGLLDQLFGVPDDMQYIIPDTTFRAFPPDSIPIPSVYKEGLRSVVQAPDQSPHHWRHGDERTTIGSNNWSIKGSNTANGNAILCNDTHLGITLPNPWYQAHLYCPEFHNYGFTIPCSPYVISGHNEHIAWGMTNAQWNLIDRYELELDSSRAMQYYCDSAWHDIEVREYAVLLPNGDSIITTQAMSVFGKVFFMPHGIQAQRWYCTEGLNRSVLAFDELSRANDWRTFNNALRNFDYPPQNFAFADREGNAGLHCAGKLPMKPLHWSGGILDGSLLPDTAMVPYQFLPNHFNAERGFSASANQMAARTDYHITDDWAEWYRARRINAYLSTLDSITLEDMMTLQYDKTDLVSEDLKALLTEQGSTSPDWNFFMPLLNWNGSSTADRPEPLIARYLKAAIFVNFGYLMEDAYQTGATPNTSTLLRFLTEHDTFCLGTDSFDTGAFLLAARDSALHHLQVDYPNFEQWRYGNATHFQMEHVLRIPGFGVIVPEYGGSSNTPNVNGSNMHAASMRTVIEMGDSLVVFTVLAGGQSGRLNSRWFMDQVPLWRDGNYVPGQFATDPTKIKGVVTQIQSAR